MKYRRIQFFCASMQHTFGVVFRTALITLVLAACVAGVLHHMGVPVPSAHQLLHSFRGSW